jgi:hypothetical protein
VRVLVPLNLIRLVYVTPRRGSLEHRYTAIPHDQLATPSAQAEHNPRPATTTPTAGLTAALEDPAS